MPLETYEQFESAARALIQKVQYAQPPSSGGDGGDPSTCQNADGRAGLVRRRVQDDGGIPVTRGWRWVSGVQHTWTRAEGYLSKQIRLPPPKAVNTASPAIISGSAPGTHPDHEVELEEEDPDQLPPPAPPSTVNVHFDVVYNKSYNVPQLLFTAWDQSGVPLPIEHLLQYGILKPPPPARMVGSDLMPDQTSPFPLVQQTEHPTTGLRVWGVHPCNVAEAIHELVSAMPPGQTTSSSDPGHEVDGGEESRLRWLELWMMLSSSIVNLT